MPTLTKKLDISISKFINKYKFFSDHIFLFYGDISSSEINYNLWMPDINYNNLDCAKKDILNIKAAYQEILLLFYNTKFENTFLKLQYKKRLDEFSLIINVIESFYNENEKLKFDLVTKSFWVDLDLCEKISKDSDIILDEFKSLNIYSYIFNEEYNILKYKHNITYDSKAIKYYFQQALKYLKIDKNWKVKISENVDSIVHWNFSNKWWTIFIPPYKGISLERLIILIVHEIDTHCIQFTWKNKQWIFSPLIRFPNSEEILEWLATYFELLFEILIFRNQSLEKRLLNYDLKLKLLNKDVDLTTFLIKYQYDKLRVFRWFNDINNYFNTKDFIYTQWLYKVIKYKNQLWKSFFNLAFSWLVNEEYILKFWKRNKNKFDCIKFIKNSSAYYILKNKLLL